MRSSLRHLRRLAAHLLLLVGLTLAAAAQTGEEAERLSPEWHELLGRPPAPPALAPVSPHWGPWHANYYDEAPGLAADWRLKPADLALWDRQLRDLVAALRHAPVATRPGPVRLWTPSGSLYSVGDEVDGVPLARHPVVGGIMLGPWPEKWTRKGPKGLPEDAGETFHLEMTVNCLTRPQLVGWNRDEEKDFGRLFRVPSPFPGATLVGDSLVITRPGKPDPYRPVSRLRVLEAQLATFAGTEKSIEDQLRNRRDELARYLSPAGQARRQERIEEMVDSSMKRNNKTEEEARRRATEREDQRLQGLEAAANPPADDPVFGRRRFCQALQARIEAMTPAERAAPAWVRAAGRLEADEPVEFREPGAPGSVPLVRLDPAAFFDPKLPRTAFQVLTVERMRDTVCRAQEAGGSDKPYAVPGWADLALIQQTDWEALGRRFLR